MASKNDYYQTLGVPKGATPEEIKQAYRKLAREHHPDMAKEADKASAEQKFKEINEAYQVLSDPQKRKMYDQFGHAGAQAGGPGGFGGFGGQQNGQWGPFSYSYSSAGGQGFEDFDPFDVFEDFFGFRGFGGQRAPKRGKNLYYEMDIEFAEAIHGAEKKVNVESGPLTVKIPAGLTDGLEMRFANKGMPGPNGTPNGDLFITFHVHVPKPFQRVGNQLAIVQEIDFVQATLGDVIEVTVVEPNEKNALSTAKLKIPAGTQSGTQFRLKGKGLPLLNRGRGDVIVQVFVRIPQKLSKKQKDLLEEYRKSL